MYKTMAETEAFLSKLQENTKDLSRDELTLFIIPSFTALERAFNTRDGSVLLGAQNMYPEEQGAFTGEISVRMLREFDLDLVMTGHSERRHVFGETDEDEARKVACTLRNGMRSLLCVGETAQQKNNGVTDEVLRSQLKIGLRGVGLSWISGLWIAYEPVWAIGEGGQPATADYAEEKHAVIRDMLTELYGDAGNDIPIFYGGSVNAQNAVEFIPRKNVDGLFVGRSAWDADAFDKLIRLVLPLWKEKIGQ